VHEDLAEQQADIVRLLLHHVQAPLGDDQYIRGVMPPLAEAVRVVTGTQSARTSDELTVWEIPLRGDDGSEDLIGGEEIFRVLRALHTGTHIYSSDRIGTVMGMTLIQVDLAEVGAAAVDVYEDAFTLLRTLTCPWTEEQAALRLRGFLLYGPDQLRLYLDQEGSTEVVAADVRPSGRLTSLLAALPSLIGEEERARPDDTDPHCSSVVDLTGW
jgi:hypothetical protein